MFVACPHVELDALIFPCALDTDCPPDQRCDGIDRRCVAPSAARPEPVPRDAAFAQGPLLGFAFTDDGVVRWYVAGAYTATAELTHDPGDDALAHSLEGGDVAAVAGSGALAYTFFADGRLARGPAGAPDREPVGRWVGAPAASIAGIAVRPDGTSVTWLRDGTILNGTPDKLADDGPHASTLRLPLGKRIEDAEAFAIDADGRTHVWFRDGSTGGGDEVDALDDPDFVRPGRLVGLAVSREPRSYLYYATGWCKVLDGTLAVAFAPQSTPWTGDWSATATATVDGAWVALPDARRADTIVGVAMGEVSPRQAHAYFTDGARSVSAGPYDFSTAAVPTTLLPSDTVGLIDLALVENDDTFAFVTPDGVYKGEREAPLQEGPRATIIPGEQSLDTLVAIGGELRYTRTATRVGSFWAIFEDGSIAEGRSFDLGGEPIREDLGYRAIDGP